MQDTLGVGVFHCACDRRDESCRLARWQRAGSAHPLRQRLTANELHAQVRLPAARADIVDGDDVWVLEARGGLGLGAEPGAVLIGSKVCFADHLERNHAVQALLSSLIDHSHAAPAQFFE